MRLKNYNWTFPSAIPPAMCDQIIQYGLSQIPVKGKHGGQRLTKLRDSDVAWIYDKWVLDICNEYIIKANKDAGWNFQWAPVDFVQFTQYNVGQYYGWHRDTQIPETFEANSQIRKLSITINLNDDYEGGEFYIDAEEQYGKTSPRLVDTLKPKGSISVFPSDIWHKVDPVTKGTRYSIVVWVKGDPFK